MEKTNRYYAEIAHKMFDDRSSYISDIRRLGHTDDEIVDWMEGLYKEGTDNRAGTFLASIFGDSTRIDITDYIAANRTKHKMTYDEFPSDTQDAYYTYLNALDHSYRKHLHSISWEGLIVADSGTNDDDVVHLTEDFLKKDHNEIFERVFIGGFEENMKGEGWTLNSYSRINARIVPIGFTSFTEGYLETSDTNYYNVYVKNDESYWSGFSVTFDVPNPIIAGRRTYKSLRKLHKTIATGENAAHLDSLLAALESSIHKSQDDMGKGRYYLSVDPLDFLTMSTNDCGWSSCISMDGSYSYGAFGSYIHPEFLMVYKTTSDERNMEAPVPIHDKTMRQLFYLNDNGVAAGKAYPRGDKGLEDAVLRKLFTFFSEELKSADWDYDNEINVMYDDMNGYNPTCFTIDGNDFVLGEYYINDILGDGFESGDGCGLLAYDRCNYCGKYEYDCECTWCEQCDEHMENCECERCGECGDIINPQYGYIQECECERHEECGNILSECECIKCDDCGNGKGDCYCPSEVESPQMAGKITTLINAFRRN